MPLDKDEAKKLIGRRSPEWCEFERHWRFLADSYEGGNRYKYADYAVPADAVRANPLTGALEAGPSSTPWYNYGRDALTSEPYSVSYGQIVDRNLIPHLRETGDDGRDLYAMRLHRTPVPEIVGRAVETHLSRIYSKEVRREGPDGLRGWWADVDGRGTTMDRWMQEVAAPLLLVLGQLDVYIDHPPAPEGEVITSQADVDRLGLGAAVASVVLPENVLWWRLDDKKARYAEVLVFVRTPETFYYRHLTTTENNAYDHNGELIPGLSREHGFGIVPMVRVFDRRVARCEHVGKSRYESVAQIQRAYYNALSERILSGVQQCHAQLQGPEDYLQQDNAIPIGPDCIHPMKPIMGPNGMVSGYQGWSYLDPPKGAQEALRTDLMDLLDAADRDSALAKPAGVSGGSVGQSGVSKVLDAVDGNARLAKIADTLAAAETQMARLAARVLSDGRETAPDFAVTYPKQFDLYTADNLAQALDDIQRMAQTAGALPELQGELIGRLIDSLLPGLSDERQAELRDEYRTFLSDAAALSGLASH